MRDGNGREDRGAAGPMPGVIHTSMTTRLGQGVSWHIHQRDFTSDSCEAECGSVCLSVCVCVSLSLCLGTLHCLV